MVSSHFESILKEFEPFFNCPLVPDSNDSCLVKMNNGLSIYIEINQAGQLLIGTKLGVLHMGRHRENLVQAALKSNDMSLSSGIFGFSNKSSQLILFMLTDPHQLHSVSLLLTPFIAKAKKWLDAIEKGEVPLVERETPTPRSPFGIFGMKF